MNDRRARIVYGVVMAGMTAWHVAALPAGRDVYFGVHYNSNYTERTYYRDGVTVMPGANRLQPVLTKDGINDGVWTNAAQNYLYGNDVLYTGFLAATTLGDDPLLGEYADGSGEWNTRIEGGDTETGGNIYYVRVFSAPTITGAAYYADTTNIVGTFPTIEYEEFTDMVVNVVNPAYEIAGFEVRWPGAWEEVGDSMVAAYGVVGTTEHGGNNHLADAVVSVRWENVRVGVSGYVGVSNGDWRAEGIPIEVGEWEIVTNELRFIAVGQSERPGLPVSRELRRQVLGVPEPWAGGWLVMLMALQGKRKWRCS